MMLMALGIVGMVALVICYVSMLFGKLKGDSYKFLFGNLVGAVCLMINGFGLLSGAMLVYPLLNVVWTFGTLIQIYRECRSRRKLRVEKPFSRSLWMCGSCWVRLIETESEGEVILTCPKCGKSMTEPEAEKAFDRW